MAKKTKDNERRFLGVNVDRTIAELPLRPSSPPPLNSHYTPYWFKYATAAFKEMGQEVCLKNDVSDEELGFTKAQREDAEKHHECNRQNFFIRDSISGQIYIVKHSLDSLRSYKEWVINQKLREFNIPNTIPALCWFEGREGKTEPLDGFLIIPFKKNATPGGVLLHSDIMFSRKEFFDSLKQILGIFASFDPTQTDKPFRLVYRDITLNQLLYQSDTKMWFLIDFGVVDAVYWDDQTKEYVKVSLTGYDGPNKAILPLVLGLLTNFYDMPDELDETLSKLESQTATTYLNAVNEYYNNNQNCEELY